MVSGGTLISNRHPVPTRVPRHDAGMAFESKASPQIAYGLTTTTTAAQIGSYMPLIATAQECSTMYIGFFFAAFLIDWPITQHLSSVNTTLS
jgi:hypothetical protein